MKERRHVTIDKEISEVIKAQEKKVERIFTKFPINSTRYQKAKKLEEELDHFKDLIEYISRFEKENYLSLSQLEENNRFYEIKLTSIQKMKEMLKVEARKLKKDKYYNFPLCLSKKKSRKYDPNAYINVFEFFVEHDFENDFCLEKIEELLDEKGFFEGKVLTQEAWDDIVDEYRVEHWQGRIALIYVCIRERL